MSLPIALAPGTVIGGHYIVGSLINSGGFGAVYRGVDTSENNRPCAVKETYDVTPAARRQALMEASVLFTVRSAHLPEVYDALEANGRFYLIMQLIEGQNLFQLLRSRVPGGLVGEQEPQQRATGPCTEQEVLTWLLPIMDILEELHSRHPAVTHRDIKPGNIILTPQQTAVLVDFGLTRLYDPARSTQTLTRAVTEGFSPLEQYVGKTSPSSDIYALAATMYLLLTNRMPQASTRRSVRDELIAPHLLNPALSAHVEHALLKALALHAQDRYQHMHEFAQALQGNSGFTAHADPTISVIPSLTGNQPSLVLPAPPASSYNVGYNGTQSAPKIPAAATGKHSPGAAKKLAPPSSSQRQGNPVPSVRPYQQNYPMPAVQQPYPQSYPIHPAQPAQQGNMKPQAMRPPVTRALPTPANQGCLWGLVQGSLAALVVLFMRNAAAFDLAVMMGFVFYFLAGFTTTHRGGSSLRGAWAGYWAGITSTFTFWFAFGVGILVRISQYMQSASGGVTFNDAWQAVKPNFPSYIVLANQPGWINLVALLIAGVVIAFTLGWMGGILSVTRRRTKMVQTKI